jgi:hypothetical protein
MKPRIRSLAAALTLMRAAAIDIFWLTICEGADFVPAENAVPIGLKFWPIARPLRAALRQPRRSLARRYVASFLIFSKI